MRQHINELVVTDGEQIICVPPQQDIQLAASLGSEKSHALAIFQALTGCDTASVLNLLDMDRKLHGMPAMELIARACYTACALTDIQEHKCAAPHNMFFPLMYSGDTQNTSFGLYPHMDMSLSKCGSVYF